MKTQDSRRQWLAMRLCDVHRKSKTYFWRSIASFWCALWVLLKTIYKSARRPLRPRCVPMAFNKFVRRSWSLYRALIKALRSPWVWVKNGIDAGDVEETRSPDAYTSVEFSRRRFRLSARCQYVTAVRVEFAQSPYRVLVKTPRRGVCFVHVQNERGNLPFIEVLAVPLKSSTSINESPHRHLRSHRV